MTCWAESLGNCSDKISREHIITDGMFPAPTLHVKGLPWCMEEFREVSVANFVKKILCEYHNNNLSPVDTAGIQVINAFRTEVQLNNARSKMNPIRWTVRTFKIDGNGLERWCLKTLINMAAEGQYKMGEDSEVIGQPSSRLVRIAFGQEKFEHRAGLYGLGRVGSNWNLGESFRVIPYGNDRGILMGGLFGIFGYQFLLALEEEGFARVVLVPDLGGGPDYKAQTLYPLMALNFNIGKYLSHRFQFVYG